MCCGDAASVEAECWVEDLEREVEVGALAPRCLLPKRPCSPQLQPKRPACPCCGGALLCRGPARVTSTAARQVLPRKSDPNCNALHLYFPAAMRGGGGEGAAAPRKGKQGVLVRVQLHPHQHGAPPAEQECACVAAIQRAHAHYAARRVAVHRQLAALLALRAASFSPADSGHRAQLASLWQSIKGPASSPPPITPEEAAQDRKVWGSGGHLPAEDWAELGFQRGDSPHSDFRGSGLLGLHLLDHYARRERAMAVSLVEAYRARQLGYPFAAAGINLSQLLVSLLLPGTAPRTNAAQPAPPAAAAAAGGPEAALRTAEGRVSRLVVVLTRVGGEEREHPLEAAFCGAFALLEQLWVMHGADYMGFNRVLSAVQTCLALWLDDEWRAPTCSLDALRAFKVARAGPLPPDPLKAWAAPP